MTALGTGAHVDDVLPDPVCVRAKRAQRLDGTRPGHRGCTCFAHGSPVGSGTTWGSYTTKPANMTNGAKRAAVAFDGSHYVLISGNWNAGLWRYVEN